MPKSPPTQILAIAEQLNRKERPNRVSVKRLLKWFGAKRRRANVISEIEDALRSAGLATNPEFSQAGSADYLTFLLTRESQQMASPPVPDNNRKPVEREPLPEVTVAAQSDRPDQASDDFLEPEVDGEQQAADDDRPVVSRPADWTITALREKWEGGLLDLQPTFQREYVWRLKPELPSRLIESIARTAFPFN